MRTDAGTASRAARTAATIALATAAILGGAAGAQAPARVEVSPAGPVRSLAVALRLVAPRGTIVVRGGTWREGTIAVTKPVTIQGVGGPVLDGEGKHEIMTVHADDVTIRGLTFRAVGYSEIQDKAALRVTESSRCRIEDNVVEDGFFGIYLARVEGCVVRGNRLRSARKTEANAGNGIHLWTSREVVVTDNDIRGWRDGIYFEFVRASRAERNTSEGNIRYGLHFMYSDSCRYVRNTFRHNGSGVAVMYTNVVEMTENRFEDNWGAAAYGLLLKEIGDPVLRGNRFSRNTVGLFSDGATRLVATGNEFRGNGWAVQLQANTQDGRFTGNDFLANTFDVATNAGSSTTVFDGNHFDEYAGYDLDRDGVGDVPHRPVRLFSLIVASHEAALVLLRSFFVGLLDAAERVIPALTPEMLVDAHPAMRPVARGTP